MRRGSSREGRGEKWLAAGFGFQGMLATSRCPAKMIRSIRHHQGVLPSSPPGSTTHLSALTPIQTDFLAWEPRPTRVLSTLLPTTEFVLRSSFSGPACYSLQVSRSPGGRNSVMSQDFYAKLFETNFCIVPVRLRPHRDDYADGSIVASSTGLSKPLLSSEGLISTLCTGARQLICKCLTPHPYHPGLKSHYGWDHETRARN